MSQGQSHTLSWGKFEIVVILTRFPIGTLRFEIFRAALKDRTTADSWRDEMLFVAAHESVIGHETDLQVLPANVGYEG
ncbi:hypothetical protein CP49_41200 [Bradyrhizobium valentinum]|uniref:Uncharacterized protein n=1 Tax=Bradyrhizobium valentinum TaxID=1518501 RepID=A0A0R3LHT5_9BRAD|nr:hypothetical protein CP49_41200 [Bradyrhizobium valentinum]